MAALIEFAGTSASEPIFLTWTPRQASVRVSPGSAGAPVAVDLTAAGIGGLLFDDVRSDHGKATLRLPLPADGTPAGFWISGKFGSPSANLGDVAINVTAADTGAVIGTRAVTLRIRKDAQTLLPTERDRFLTALGTLNAKGHGPYLTLRDMHTAVSDQQMHGNSGFLPWHRAYVLDLERALQSIDPMVTVPYWRFDQPAPDVFTADFMGAPSSSRLVSLRPGHPLEGWVTDGQTGISRTWQFAVNGPAPVATEAQTMALGGVAGAFSGFRQMEGDPHGAAHVSFGRPISNVPTAVRDPLFLMLHSNVDRLWAKWQWVNHRSDPGEPLSYAAPRPDRDGHRLADTTWPWNGVTGGSRPPTAPGGPFPTRPALGPGGAPTVQSMLDYLAIGSPEPLGFAYDDVPFELPPGANA